MTASGKVNASLLAVLADERVANAAIDFSPCVHVLIVEIAESDIVRDIEPLVEDRESSLFGWPVIFTKEYPRIVRKMRREFGSMNESTDTGIL